MLNSGATFTLSLACAANTIGVRGGLKLDVEQKIKDMLKLFPELAKLPYKTVPLQPSQVNKELKVGDIKPLTAIDEYLIKEYPKIIGTMIYIAITARPDIAYAVGKLSRGMHQPNKLHCGCKHFQAHTHFEVAAELRTDE